MSSMSTSSDPPVDVEKGATGVKAAKEVNPRVAMCIKVFLDAVAVLQVLFFIGFFMWTVSIAKNWWDPWPALVILLPITVFTLWIKPKTKYATEPTPGGSDISDLSNKLLAEK